MLNCPRPLGDPCAQLEQGGLLHRCLEEGRLLEQSLAKKDYIIDESFSEVPARLMAHPLWSTCFSGIWQYMENIGVLEARALVASLRRIALTFFGRDVKQVLLVDN